MTMNPKMVKQQRMDEIWQGVLSPWPRAVAAHRADRGGQLYVSNFPEDVPISRLMSLAHRRWTVEQGYQQLKEE